MMEVMAPFRLRLRLRLRLHYAYALEHLHFRSRFVLRRSQPDNQHTVSH